LVDDIILRNIIFREHAKEISNSWNVGNEAHTFAKLQAPLVNLGIRLKGI
jgi:hypothetical protein